MELIVRPHLLSARDTERVEVPEGSTLGEMVRAFHWAPGTDDHVCALINGRIVPREWWEHVRPKPGAEVLCALALRGGRQGNKQALQIIATIVLVVVANAYGAQVAAGMNGAITAAQATAGITLIGNLALGALFKPPPIHVNQNMGDTSNTYTFQGQSNAVKPYGVIPRILGKHRVYPDVVGSPYTSLNGKDQYITAVYCFGYGPVNLTDIKIGEDLIQLYNPELVTHRMFKAGDLLQIYTSDVVQDQLALTLNYNVPAIFTTRTETDSASFDMNYSAGLGYIHEYMGFSPYPTYTTVEYRKVGDTDWIPFQQAPSWEISNGDNKIDVPMGLDNDFVEYVGTEWFIQGGSTARSFEWPGNIPPPVGTKVEIAGYVYTITGLSPIVGGAYISPPIVETYPVTSFWPRYGSFKSRMWNPSNAVWSITEARAQPFLASMTLRFPERGQWQFRVTQMEPETTDLNTQHKRTIVSVRSMRRTSPISPDAPVTLLEVKIKATEQLSGVVSNLSAIASAEIKGWNGSAWVLMETSNPAWEYVELLQGVANKRPVPDSRIDWDAIKAWGAYCDSITSGFIFPTARCDFVVDKGYTLWDLLASVASNGRAMPTMRDNKYSVIVDQRTPSPVQVFTPRNSWGLTSRRKYIEAPDALRVKWIDPQIGYNENQTIVYNDGFDVNNARAFEELSLFGVTTWEQANRSGRVALARGKLQQEEFTLSSDIENIICVRGDMVGIAHDVMQVGGWSARIATRAGDSVTFDAPLKPFDAPLGARVRTDDAQLSGILPMSAGTGGAYVITGLPANTKVGDLVVYGTVGTVTGWYLVKGVEPGPDFTAQMTFIEYAPGIWDAETGSIPPYVPQGGSVGQIAPSPVLALTATVNHYAIGRYNFADVLLQWSPPIGPSVNPEIYIISLVNADGTLSEVGRTADLNFKALSRAPTDTTPYGDTVQTFDVAPAWPGIRGPGSQIQASITKKTPAAYPPLTGVTATPHNRGVLVSWAASTADALAYYVIRYGPAGATWDSAAATEQKIKANRTDLPATFLVGSYVAMVTQEDTFGVRSTPVSASFAIVAPRIVNIVGTAVQNTTFLRWANLATSDPGEWGAQTTFQIEYYTVQKTRTGSTYGAATVAEARAIRARMGDAEPDPVVFLPEGTVLAGPAPTAGTVQMLGKYSAEFAILNEQQEGLWEYCVSGVDIAGNAAPFNCVTLLVESPDNYFLLDEVANLLPLPETTKTYAANRAGTFLWLAPIDTAETWQQHFVSEGWDQPSDQTAAGFPIYVQPGAGQTAVFSWEHDYGQNLPSLRVNSMTSYTAIAGTPSVVVVIYGKALAADPWLEIGRADGEAAALLAPGTRYVRIQVEVKTDAARKGLALMDGISYRLDVRYRDDAGTITTPASGIGTVTFNVPFIDVRSVQLTSADPAVAYARYQVAANQKSMTVYTFNSTGTPTGGKVAWWAQGI